MILDYAQIAQSVEQGIENPRVGSSILSLGTISISKPRHARWGFFGLCRHRVSTPERRPVESVPGHHKETQKPCPERQGFFVFDTIEIEPLPLAVLNAKVDEWITGQSRAN